MDEGMKKSAGKPVSRAVVSRMVTLLLGGLSFVAALAWNDAIQSAFAKFFDPKTGGILLKFLYAALVTVGITLVSLRLSRYLGENGPPSDQK